MRPTARLDGNFITVRVSVPDDLNRDTTRIHAIRLSALIQVELQEALRAAMAEQQEALEAYKAQRRALRRETKAARATLSAA